MSNDNNRKNQSKSNNKKSKVASKDSSTSSSSSWGARVHTLNTIDAFSSSTSNTHSSNSYSSSNNSSSSSSSSSSNNSKSTFKIQHIPNLPSSDYAASILKRIQTEFSTMVQKRGYSITSVTEMCCCDDGLNYLGNASYNGGNGSNGSNGSNGGKTKGKKRGRKTRQMPNNVLGYNLTHGYRNSTRKTVHRIHLRLRHPNTKNTTHSTFYPYEDIAGTMCHELTHCEIGPHNAHFYKLMDCIMDQYSVFLVRGVIMDKDGFPVGSTESYTLGKGSGTSSSGGGAGLAAQKRLQQRKQQGMGGTYVLGGGLSYIQEVKRIEQDQKKNGFNMYGNGNSNNSGSNRSSMTSSSTSSTSRLNNLPPKQAARIAAERRMEERRLNDSKYCLPCQEIIEILDGSSSDEEEDDDGISGNGSNGGNGNNDDNGGSDDDIVVIIKEEKNSNGIIKNNNSTKRGDKLKKDGYQMKHQHVKSSSGTSSNISNSSSSNRHSNSHSRHPSSNINTNTMKVKGTKVNNQSVNNNNDIIDLLDDSSDEEELNRNAHSSLGTRTANKSNTKIPPIHDINENGHESGHRHDPRQWNCKSCTFTNKPMSLSCQLCGALKNHQESNLNSTSALASSSASISFESQHKSDNNNKEQQQQQYQPQPQPPTQSNNYWTCTKCTFAQNRQLALSCQICGIEREYESENNNDNGNDAAKGNTTKKVIETILKQDFINDVKEKEKEKSKRQFNGFNIYGNDKRSSSTMNHLT